MHGHTYIKIVEMFPDFWFSFTVVLKLNPHSVSFGLSTRKSQNFATQTRVYLTFCPRKWII